MSLKKAMIKKLSIFNDNVIEIKVECPYCNNVNIHTITHATSKYKNCLSINFEKLGLRACDNIKCYEGQYTLN